MGGARSWPRPLCGSPLPKEQLSKFRSPRSTLKATASPPWRLWASNCWIQSSRSASCLQRKGASPAGVGEEGCVRSAPRPGLRPAPTCEPTRTLHHAARGAPGRGQTVGGVRRCRRGLGPAAARMREGRPPAHVLTLPSAGLTTGRMQVRAVQEAHDAAPVQDAQLRLQHRGPPSNVAGSTPRPALSPRSLGLYLCGKQSFGGQRVLAPCVGEGSEGGAQQRITRGQQQPAAEQLEVRSGLQAEGAHVVQHRAQIGR